MKLLYLGLLIIKIMSVVADSIISINDLIPEPNPVIEWSVGSEQDVTFARKLFELVVIRKLQLLHGRGDIPSLRLWVKNLVESEMVKSTAIISEIIYTLEENHINIDLLPEGWKSLAREGKSLKRLADNLEKNDNFTTWEILNVAWAAFDYWAIVQEVGLPNNPEEWWNSGPMELIEQVRAKRSLVENFPGLNTLAKCYSSICTSYENKIISSSYGESMSESEIRDLSHKHGIYTMLRYVWNYCPKVLESILTSVNRHIILKDEGQFARQNGVPYLSDSTGNVRLLLSPNGYALPYNLNSQSGKDRLEYHLNIQVSGIDQSKSGESNNIPLFPEQERLFWILTNIFSALKSIKWTNGDIELGYINGLEKNSEYETAKELWSAFAYNSIGQIHPELDILNSCLYSDNSSQLQLFMDLLHEQPVSTDLKIAPLYTILIPEHSQNTISENKVVGEGISMEEKREAKYEDLYATKPDSTQPSNQILEVLDTGSPFKRVLRSKDEDEDEDEDNYYTEDSVTEMISPSTSLKSELPAQVNSSRKFTPPTSALIGAPQTSRTPSDVPKETSFRSSISPKNISPRSSTSPKNISPRNSTSPKNISPGSYTSPKNINPGSYTSPKNINPGSYTSPKNISPGSSTSPKNISPGSSTSPKNISPGSYTSPKNISPGSYTSPKNTNPINPVSSECVSITSPNSPECIGIISPGLPRNNNSIDYNLSTETFSPHSFRSTDFNKSSKDFKNLKTIESKFKDLVSFEDIGENPKVLEFEVSPKPQEESDIKATYFEVYSASSEVNSADIPIYSHSLYNSNKTTTSPIKYPYNLSIQDLSAQSPKVSEFTEQMTPLNLTSVDLISSPVYTTKDMSSSVQLPLLGIVRTHSPIKERLDLPEMGLQTTDSVLALVGSIETPVSSKTQPTASDGRIAEFNIKEPVEIQSITNNTENKGLHSNSSRVIQDILNEITEIQSSITLKDLNILATSN
ncbi:uncharacterized protein CMU_039760 [Cryptosporidium muris RN66]|uniref:Uncharacterized protein n=1 Tax=Cryptosporidium muris (strain RN66) TaxID=441375 RepID=B6A9L6_CRYMR|nr:uncharacterized protein CMU_039760 [Cryptosporidium muris RN66]EEA04907.1 hypothetical protein, conserved [Cryptosporidium muris RN66]|eukprot:XP_002139256.1 hypothetical protein [Cryptosporidium muris RN66]